MGLYRFKKSRTCEEGGAHLRIPFWHLLMNLKNFLGHFLSFQPPDNPENQNFKIETPADIIILHICTINDNHMMYGS